MQVPGSENSQLVRSVGICPGFKLLPFVPHPLIFHVQNVSVETLVLVVSRGTCLENTSDVS